MTTTAPPPQPLNRATSPAPNLYLAQARAALSAADCMTIYDKWAATYDLEVTDTAQNYVAPLLVAQVALKSTLSPSTAEILDAGCGTGLVGRALAQSGARVIDGIDLSVPMLDVARRAGVYRNLDKADLNARVEKRDGVYDIVTCVGTFTLGHVGPDPALRELVRVVKGRGVVVATVLDEIWEKGGFRAEVEKMRKEGLVRVVAEELVDYVKGHGDKAILLVLEKCE